MGINNFQRSKLRVKGQVTVPSEIRNILGAEEGDELVFMVDESGRVYLERVEMIPPDQAWFWRERWQRIEREVQQDIEDHKIMEFDTAEDALDYLDNITGDTDAENNTH